MNATANIPAATVTDFGFWGTMQEHAPAAWAIALPTIASATGCEPEQVRAFLDSRHGRHFADDVATVEACVFTRWRCARGLCKLTVHTN